MPLEENESEESLIDIGYPLKLTNKRIKAKNGTKISEREMWALQNTLHILQKKWRPYGVELYINFFTEHHQMINRFRDRTTGKLNPIIMSQHGIAMFNMFQDIIHGGLRHWPKAMRRIDGITRCHVAHGVTLIEMQLMMKAIKDVVISKCGGLISPTVEIAFGKLGEECFEQHIARQLTAADDVPGDLED